MSARGALMVCGVVCAVLAPAAMAAGPLPDGVIAPDVSIDGVPVGGLTIDAARIAVTNARVVPHLVPLPLSFNGRQFSIKPSAAGYFADVNQAIDTALTYGRVAPVTGPVNIALPQLVDRVQLGTVLAYRARDVEIAPVDAALTFRNARPRVRSARVGTLIDMPRAVALVADALVSRSVPEVVLPVRRVRPTRTRVGPSIVISRGTRVLTLYRESKRVKTFRIAVGTPSHPTPRGLFSIIEKQRNPTWIPPDSPWAKGLGPIPPGPGNPLGTRWMGTSASAVGIHGTNASSSIGTAASHGCIRMYVRDSEWLYERVSIGTPVLIV